MDTIWGEDEPTVRLQPPVDPWAAHDGHTEEIPIAPPARRPVYGRVYELITGDPQDGLHPYVGQTTTTIHRRVHGPNGHTSPQSIAKDPWKARIRPGRAGYRCLKTIYATGDPGSDQVRLDMAEAFAIDELKTTHNDQRPIRPVGDAPRRRTSKPATRSVRTKRRRAPARVWVFLILTVVFTFLTARLTVAMHLPWPAVPWVASPAVGVGLAWRVLWSMHRKARRLLGRRR
jgi:hypothetical protein